MMSKKVSLIMALHNRADLTVKCLESLSRETLYPNWELVLIDNASTDDTPKILESLEGDVKILTADENLGYARANNWGARQASGDYLCFLNNDTVVTRNWLKSLVECIESHPAAAACGAKLLFPDGKIQHAGIVFDKIDRIGYHLYRGLSSDAPEVNKVRKFGAVTGACMLVNKDLFFHAGCFDEGYVNGFEDVDLCLTLGENHGEIYYTPDSVVYHYTGSTPGRNDHDQKNADRFQKKWLDKIIPDEDIVLAEDGYRADWKGTNCTLRKISADVIVYAGDGFKYLKRCLISIKNNTLFPDFQVIVVCSGDDHETVSYVESLGNKYKLIVNRNLEGRSDAYNTGARACEGDYIAFLESTVVVGKGWLLEMIKTAVDPKVGAVGSKIMNPDLTIAHAGIVFKKNDGSPYYIYSGHPEKAYYVNRQRDYRAVSSACMLVKRPYYSSVGGLDVGYKTGMGDIDLCLKLNEAGCKIRYSPRAAVSFQRKTDLNSRPLHPDDLERFRLRMGGNIQRDEAKFYREDKFWAKWDSDEDIHLKYAGPRIAILISTAGGWEFAQWYKLFKKTIVFPEYQLYINHTAARTLETDILEEISILEGDSYDNLSEKLKEPIFCRLKDDFLPLSAWLTRLFEWALKVDGGDLILAGNVSIGKGFPDLARETVSHIDCFRVKIGD